MTELTKDRVEWKFGAEEKRAWDTLKRRCVESPVLLQADLSKELLLDTDASKTGLGELCYKWGTMGECTQSVSSQES